MVASDPCDNHFFAAHQHLSVSEIPENQRYREHMEIKVGFWCFGPSFALAEDMRGRASYVARRNWNFQLFIEFQQQSV